jgi:monomeric sarcosine oxidase
VIGSRIQPQVRGRQAHSADVIVIGAGIVGLATAAEIARQNRDVLVLERFRIGNDRGSSRGSSRFRQLAPHPTAEFVEMGICARRMWGEIEDRSSEPIFRRTGNLSVGEPQQLKALSAAVRDHGAPCELVHGSVASARWPYLRVLPGATVAYQSDGEVINAGVAMRAMLRSARAADARIVEHCRAASIDAGRDGVTLSTSTERLRAQRVVITTGPWANQLLAGAGIEIPVSVSTQTITYFRLDGFVPPTVTDWSDREPYSLLDPVYGLKAAEHSRGPIADPDSHQRPDAEAVRRITGWVRGLFPAAAPTPHHVETCFYTNAPEDRFIVERRGDIVIGSACSGQGFQFAPLVGRRLAELACA